MYKNYTKQNSVGEKPKKIIYGKLVNEQIDNIP